MQPSGLMKLLRESYNLQCCYGNYLSEIVDLIQEGFTWDKQISNMVTTNEMTLNYLNVQPL